MCIRLIDRMTEHEGITEMFKAENQIGWNEKLNYILRIDILILFYRTNG